MGWREVGEGCIIILSNNGYEKDRKILDPKTHWKGLVRRGVPRRLRRPTVRAQNHLQASAQREGDPQSIGVDAVADQIETREYHRHEGVLRDTGRSGGCYGVRRRRPVEAAREGAAQ